MKHITLTRHKFSSAKLLALAKKEHRPWIRRRIRALAAIKAGKLSREAIARRYNTDSDQIRLWLKRYNAEGLAGLADKPGRGAKRSLTPRRERSLKTILKYSPRKAGIATNLWTGRALRDYLKKRHWFSCSLAEAYVLIHRSGFTIQRPSRSPVEANPKAKQQFFKELQGKKRGIS